MRARFLLRPERLFIWFLGAVLKPPVPFAEPDHCLWRLIAAAGCSGAEQCLSPGRLAPRCCARGSAAEARALCARANSLGAACTQVRQKTLLQLSGETAVSGLGNAEECLKWRLSKPCTKSAPRAVRSGGVLWDTEPAAPVLAKRAPAQQEVLSRTSVPRENLHHWDRLFCLFGDAKTFLKQKWNFFSAFLVC